MARAERPLEEGDGLLLGFAADLRRLRVNAGSPAYRELSRRAHYSAAALSDAAGGRRLPSLAVTLAYVAACAGDTEEWTRRWQDVAAELTVAAESNGHGDAAREPAPYVGLAVFQREDADRFFGREQLVGVLVERVARQRFVVVVGPSGSGKSSLLRAGLLHHADQRGLHGVPGGPTVVMTPGAHPLEECAAQVATLVGIDAGSLHAALCADKRNLHRTALQTLTGQPPEVDLLIVVDQFEEIFTLCRSAQERDQFLALLDAAARAENGRTRIVLGIRADFYGHCTQRPELVDALRDAQVVVGPMTVAELRAAITQPALRADCRVENTLLSQLIADVTGQPGVLPLISHAMLETWRRRRGNTLTLTGYVAAGGITDSIARTAESVFAELNPERQRWARQLFTRLVVVGTGTEDTKRRLDRAELDPDEDGVAVLDRLVRARLITLDRTGIEIVHEAIIRGWPRLRDWLAEDRDGLRVHRALTEAAAAWEAAHRDPELLYRGNRLAQAEHWATTTGEAALTKREREFFQDSLTARARAQTAARRQTRRLRSLLALVSVMLLIATGTTGFALRAQHTTSEQRTLAVMRNALSQAAALRTANPALALQLYLAAYRLSGLPEARSALLGAFTSPYAVRLTGHTNVVQSVAFSPSGATVATAGNDKTLRLWSIDSGHPRELVTLGGFPGELTSLSFSPDGRTLAVQVNISAGPGRVRLWDVADPAHPRELPAPVLEQGIAVLIGMRISPDGHTLATTGADAEGRGAVQFTDLADPRRPGESTVFPAGPGMITQVAFSPDHHLLATAGAVTSDWRRAGYEVRLWDLSDPRRPVELATIPGFAELVPDLQFSPDGRTLLVRGTNDLAPTLWDVTDPRQPQALSAVPVLTGTVYAAAFSPDGHTLATGLSDRTVRLWDVTDVRRPRLLTTLTGPTAPVAAVAFSPDGYTLAIGGQDSVVRLEDITPFTFPARAHGPAYGVAFHPDGHTMATGNADGTVGLWDTTNPYRPRALGLIDTGDRDHPMQSVAFGPDRHTLAAAGTNGTAGLWDITDPGHPVQVALFSGDADNPLFGAATVAVSRDGHTLAVGYAEFTTGHPSFNVRLWDISDPHHAAELATIAGLPFTPLGLAFGPTTDLLGVTTSDTVRFWDVHDPRRPQELGSLQPVAGLLEGLAFHPDGRTLATANGDHTVRLWDITDPRRPRATTTVPSNTVVYSVDFSPDGRTLAVATADHTLELWEINGNAQPRPLASLDSPGSTGRVVFSPNNQILATVDGESRTPGSLPQLWTIDPDRLAAHICDVAWPIITQSEWDDHFPGVAYKPPCGAP